MLQDQHPQTAATSKALPRAAATLFIRKPTNITGQNSRAKSGNG